jgi:hypothetical protein
MPSAGGAAGELCTCIHGCVQCANGSVRKKSTEFLTIGFAVYTTNFAFDLLVRVVPPATAAGGPFSGSHNCGWKWQTGREMSVLKELQKGHSTELKGHSKELKELKKELQKEHSKELKELKKELQELKEYGKAMKKTVDKQGVVIRSLRQTAAAQSRHNHEGAQPLKKQKAI